MRLSVVLFIILMGVFGDGFTQGHEYDSKFYDEGLVHSIIPEEGRKNISIICVPGLNLSSYIYVTTPDGRKGWGEMFADDGFDVYMINDPRYDFATGGFNIAPFDTVPDTGRPDADPEATLPWQRDIWRRWGFGNAQGDPYSDARFPTDSFDNFEFNYPYIRSQRQDFIGSVTTLIDDIEGPIILLAHSAGGPTATAAAKERLDRIEGFIMIEPTGPPTEDDFPDFSNMIMLGIYGDYIDSRNQGSRKLALETAADLFNMNGGSSEVISLPDDLGVTGNSHIYMQDNNNDFIQGIINDWIDSTLMITTHNEFVSTDDISVEVYPNPTSDYLVVNLDKSIKLSEVSIKLLDLNGVELLTIKPSNHQEEIYFSESIQTNPVLVIKSGDTILNAQIIQIQD